MTKTRRSFRFVEKLAADQHPPYFGRAGADLVQLRAPPQSSGGLLVDVAVAAETLDRFAGHPRRFFRSVENRARRILARRLAAIARPADGVDVRATRVFRRIHVGELALNQLKF